MKKNITNLSRAKELIKENILPLSTENIPLNDAIGRTLSEDIFATINQQPFANSAMDGYAINSELTNNANNLNPAIFPISPEIIKAGDKSLVPRNNTAPLAIKIMTGAPLPIGLNATIPVEEAHINLQNNTLMVTKPYPSFHNIRQAGEDFKIGDNLASRGETITPYLALLIKTSGITTIPVYKKAKVGILTTGTEFNNNSLPLEDGKVYNSNSTFLLSFLRELNCEVINLGNIEDDISSLKTLIETQLEGLNIIVSSGSVSKGIFDIIPEVLKSYGTILYHFLAIKPGKPNMLAKLKNGTLWFGLPGNPVSTAIGAKIFLSYYHLCAHHKTQNIIYAKISNSITKNPLITLYQTGELSYINGEVWVNLFKKQGSHLITRIAHANALVELEEGKATFEKGSLVPIYIL